VTDRLNHLALPITRRACPRCGKVVPFLSDGTLRRHRCPHGAVCKPLTIKKIFCPRCREIAARLSSTE